ncbi:glutathione S-transferase family protein [uncultured Acinetobacter sp.]|uniref:glutathione S-transferase family protein n=1 Tax=uncultured Acinetobacter sp. TaxID=165433 RepID=UPI00259900AB|nr:glutathione S-transferase family protein [uncultured Acinetobacter sp.]
MMQLYIANKNYSTWSMRPWLVLQAFKLPFEEVMIPFSADPYTGEFKRRIQAVHDNAKVPVLQDGDLVIWDSLAICEYLAEQFPNHALWPQDRAQRAWARSICAEMHSSFSHLRSLCSMNIQADFSAHGAMLWQQHAELRAEVARIERIWASREQATQFLCGEFSIADAFFAPVITRFKTFQLPVSVETQQYMDLVLQHPAMKKWVEAALQEATVVGMEQYPR